MNLLIDCCIYQFTGFLFYAIYGYYLGITNDCGCFGDLEFGVLSLAKHGVGMVVRNAVFTIILMFLLLPNKEE